MKNHPVSRGKRGFQLLSATQQRRQDDAQEQDALRDSIDFLEVPEVNLDECSDVDGASVKIIPLRRRSARSQREEETPASRQHIQYFEIANNKAVAPTISNHAVNQMHNDIRCKKQQSSFIYQQRDTVYTSNNDSIWNVEDMSNMSRSVSKDHDDIDSDSGESDSPQQIRQPRHKKTDKSAEYVPLTTARSYRFKDDCEKKDPKYLRRRAKNNDAVHKCRAKKEEEQKKKDARLAQLESDVALLKKQIRDLHNWRCSLPQR